MSDYRRGFGLETLYIDYLQVVTTNHYNTIANSHALQITTAYANSSQIAVVTTSRSLVTASNSGDSAT
jgi:ABC-type spermidine/putrescine transport system permease subunit II